MATVVNFRAAAPKAHWAKVTDPARARWSASFIAGKAHRGAWDANLGHHATPPRVAAVGRILDGPHHSRRVGRLHQAGRERGQRVVLSEISSPPPRRGGHPFRRQACA
eukprot:459333-Pleurochrysis_carterae.AAC.1